MTYNLWGRKKVRNHRRNTVENGSKIITLIIYVLTCYISINLMYSGIVKFVSKDLLV